MLIAGIILVSLVFLLLLVGVVITLYYEGGWSMVLLVIGGTIAAMSILGVGVYLISEGLT